VEQGSGAWAGPIGDGYKTHSPRGLKVAVRDTRSGRSGGHILKGPLECRFYKKEIRAVI
jgi:hypothetical protein